MNYDPRKPQCVSVDQILSQRKLHRLCDRYHFPVRMAMSHSGNCIHYEQALSQGLFFFKLLGVESPTNKIFRGSLFDPLSHDRSCLHFFLGMRGSVRYWALSCHNFHTDTHHLLSDATFTYTLVHPRLIRLKMYITSSF